MTDQTPDANERSSAADAAAETLPAATSNTVNAATSANTAQTLPPAERRTPTSNPVLRSALRWGLLLALAIAVIAGVVGGILDGWTGVVSALIGTAMAVVFLGITAASILLANRFIGSDLYVGAFFGIVLGGWLLKFVIFIVLAILLKGQPWVNPTIMFLSLIVGVIGSLVVDVLVMLRSRMPYASDAQLPSSPPESRG